MCLLLTITTLYFSYSIASEAKFSDEDYVYTSPVSYDCQVYLFGGVITAISHECRVGSEYRYRDCLFNGLLKLAPKKTPNATEGP